MALSRFILPFADVGEGIKPASGAKLNFYATGTGTRKKTYSDSVGTIPNANPVIADSTGVFSDIFIEGLYKVVLQDKNGVQQWEADPVTSAYIGDLSAIARSLNVLDSQVIYSTDTVTPIGEGDGVDYIYNAAAQTTWGVPDGVGAGETIVSVSGSDLVTSGGSYTLIGRMIDGRINMVFYGAKAGGFDNKIAFQLAFDSVQDPALVRGDRYFYKPSSFVLPYNSLGYYSSGEVTLAENAKIDFQDNDIHPMGNPTNMFVLNLRDYFNSGSGTPGYYYRAHVQGMQFRNCFIGSPRAFGSPTAITDFDHFIYIDGGWIIRSGFYDIKTQPGASYKSIIHVDLTHQNPNSLEVGVPDGIDMHNVSAQYSENCSYTISFVGDDAKIGSGSRCGAISYKNLYGGALYAYDWNRQQNVSDDFGVIRQYNVITSENTYDFVFGGEHLINVPTPADLDLSVIKAGKFTHINVEKNADRGVGRGAMLPRGKYVECDFEHIVPYSEMNLLTRDAQLLDIIAIQCEFKRLLMNDLGHGAAYLPSDYFNLQGGSWGNTLKYEPTSRETNHTHRAFMSSMFSEPATAGTYFEYLERKSVTVSGGQLSALVGGEEFKIVNVAGDAWDLLSTVNATANMSHFTGNTSSVELRILYDNGQDDLLAAYTNTAGEEFTIDITLTPALDISPLWNAFNNRYFISTSITAPNVVIKSNAQKVIQLEQTSEVSIYVKIISVAGAGSFWDGGNGDHFYNTHYVNKV